MANLLETVAQAGTFSTLIRAIETAGLKEALTQPGPLTLLAPSDDAFTHLPEGNLDSLLQDIPKLKKVMAYHILFGDVRSDDLAQIDEAYTMEGSVVAVEQNGGIKVNEATVTEMDILTDNGVIHRIDQVLMPAMVAGH